MVLKLPVKIVNLFDTSRIVGSGLGSSESQRVINESGSGQGLILIEEVTVATATDSIIFSGLSGDIDDTYVLFWRWIKPSGNIAVLEINPNSDTTTFLTQRVIAGTTSAPSRTPTGFFLEETGTGGPLIKSGMMIISARTGIERVSHTNAYHTGTPDVIASVTEWDDTTSNITSFDLNTNNKNGGSNKIGVNSTFSLFKIRQ